MTASAADVGQPAPEFKIKPFNGDEFVLSAARGQVVILHFWATWCVPCQKEMPALDAYYRQHRSEGLSVVAIAMDKENLAKAQTGSAGYAFVSGPAKQASFKGYGRIWRLPLTFVIDRKGILRADGWDGNKSGIDAAALDATVTPLLKEKP